MAASETHMTLYRIEKDLVTLLEAREEAEDDATRKACDEAISQYAARELVKVDGLIAYLRQCDIMATAAKQEAERIRGYAKLWEERSDRIKLAALKALELAGKKSIEGRTGKLLAKGNGGKRALVITDETIIPSDYTPMTITYPLDKDKLRSDLETGAKIPGAYLEPRGTHLEVK